MIFIFSVRIFVEVFFITFLIAFKVTVIVYPSKSFQNFFMRNFPTIIIPFNIIPHSYPPTDTVYILNH